MDLAMQKGDLDTVSQQSVALLGVLNAKNTTANPDDPVDEDEQRARTAARDKLLGTVLAVAGMSPPSGTFTLGNLAAAVALTDNACEVSPGSIVTGTNFVSNLVEGSASFSVDAAKIAGSSLSNLIVTSTPSEVTNRCEPAATETSRRRTLQSAAQAIGQLTCGGDGECGDGRCSRGECLCSVYACHPGRCIEERYQPPPGTCMLNEDRCTEDRPYYSGTGDGYCIRSVCSMGYCAAKHKNNCVDGICVPKYPNSTEVDCFPATVAGVCDASTQSMGGFFVGDYCNMTQEAQQNFDFLTLRAALCLTENIHASVAEVSSKLLKERVVGEADVPMETEAMAMTSTRLSGDDIDGGAGSARRRRRMTTAVDHAEEYGECTHPRVILPASVANIATEDQLEEGLSAQNTNWAGESFYLFVSGCMLF
jgi:hypothetical protein